jgi:hypothetical protein
MARPIRGGPRHAEVSTWENPAVSRVREFDEEQCRSGSVIRFSQDTAKAYSSSVKRGSADGCIDDHPAQPCAKSPDT